MTGKILERCGCGKIPTRLFIENVTVAGKWAYVSGDCCGDWELEFRLSYWEIGSSKAMDLATDRWNSAPRLE